MYDKTVTVFNKYTDQNDNIYWYPHVLSGVDLIIDKAANVAKTGLDSADTANLHVKYCVAGSKKIVGDKPYLPPKEWEKQPNDDLPGSITFWGFLYARGICRSTDFGFRLCKPGRRRLL